MKELNRKVSNEVRRLHKLMIKRYRASEFEFLSNVLRFDRQPAHEPDLLTISTPIRVSELIPKLV